MPLFKSLAIAFCLLLSLPTFAELKAGDRFPDIEFTDQFDKKHKINNQDKLLLISFDKKVSEQVHEFLSTQEKDFLSKHNARYIADISGMPSLISKMFALPKMRDYTYTLLLIKDKVLAERLSPSEDKLLVFRLENGNIQEIKFISPSKVALAFSKP
ncbi:FAD/FMN-containing dehydrogenase [uncultured Pseudoteredinibacter sp.]|uniref:FAD/FMN-containing dehydrogenase n=1 Tax=uncultured Pseudoteredinibacter sp. TaxID=1641701 RepID=UPI002631CEA6|nr:FAD/FMN-containing dehydrogenase [uncultured Pseudoteredinibacter sp.]